MLSKETVWIRPLYTRIWHSPVMGIYKGWTEITAIYKIIGEVGFVWVGKIRREKTEPAGSEELRPILKEPLSVVRNHAVLCVWL